MDFELQRLRRRRLEDPQDGQARFSYCLSAIRAGQESEIALEDGDIVEVNELESPWVRGPWRGQIIRIMSQGDKYVKPLDKQPNYRVRPSQEYLNHGLYLTRIDACTLLEPHLPEFQSLWKQQEVRIAKPQEEIITQTPPIEVRSSPAPISAPPRQSKSWWQRATEYLGLAT